MKVSNENALLFSVFAVGVIFGLIFQGFSQIEIDPKVNISDFLSMLTSVAIGAYIGITITGRQSASRSEKDYLISEARKITEYIDSNRLFRNLGEIPFNDAKAVFKDINIQLTYLENILPNTAYSQGLSMANVRSDFKVLREEILNIRPANQIIKPTKQQSDLITKRYMQLKQSFFKLIVSINSNN